MVWRCVPIDCSGGIGSALLGSIPAVRDVQLQARGELRHGGGDRAAGDVSQSVLSPHSSAAVSLFPEERDGHARQGEVDVGPVVD